MTTLPRTRLKQIQQHLKGNSKKEVIRIGDTEMEVEPLGSNPELIPLPDFTSVPTENQEVLAHLRWMMQKGNLGQDMFLIGNPGPIRRQMAFLYARLRRMEIEYVAISRDLTDSDLKQRREILANSAYYKDQACVRAAIHGRILVLDGIEKAERNVLPILNNLLENREMALEDGRFLMMADKYDALLKKLGKVDEKFVRTSEKFLVIALGLSTPKYDGYSLDPPFRSRFQARLVSKPSLNSQQLQLINRQVPGLERVYQLQQVLQDVNADQGYPIPSFPSYIERFKNILTKIPDLDPRDVLVLVYPFLELSNADSQMVNVVNSILERFALSKTEHTDRSCIFLQNCEPDYSARDRKNIKLMFRPTPNDERETILAVPAGPLESKNLSFYVETPYHLRCLTLMLLAHSVGDFCLVGEKGSGKSILTRRFAYLLGYSIEFVPLYKDLSSRDLLQRRGTNEKGDTIWTNSGLVNAALSGSIALLDPIDVLPLGTLSSLQRFVMEREVSLPDGTHLIGFEKYQELLKGGSTSQELSRKGIFMILPSFRIIALARPDKSSLKRGRWLNGEILSMFSFLPTRPMHIEEEKDVLNTLFPGINSEKLQKLVQVAQELRSEKDDSIRELASNFSTRQLIRLARRLTMYPADCLFSAIMKVSLFRFLPILAKDALSVFLTRHNITEEPVSDETLRNITTYTKPTGERVLKIGSVEGNLFKDAPLELIPNVLFYENERQTLILQDILKDYMLGEHLLLVGNQGVGKNKIIDYFLQRMEAPREYIQLHRDTTVYNLTSSPNIVNGILIYNDSPLVKSVKKGYILVVDEVDKAPTHVTRILKTLVEDGEMVLADGRRIVSRENPAFEKADIVIHPNFRMICLANRPGFPFLGNDFYQEIGDVFACHCIDNPDPDSELELLMKYAPSTSKDILIKLIASFSDLRMLVDSGVINYPYSTRELVNVVKHLHFNPGDGISGALQNVFDFDTGTEIREIIREIMNKNGIPTNMESSFKVELGEKLVLPEPVVIEKWTFDPNKSQVLVATFKDIDRSGTWPFEFPKIWEALEQINGRSSIFSEWLYTFKLFSGANGATLDLLIASDRHLFAVSSSPVTLIVISPNHRKQKRVPLYEFIPSSKITKLTLVEAGVGRLAIHNSEDHYFVIVDFVNNTVTKALVRGLDPVLDSVCSKVSHGLLCLYQKKSNCLVLIDLVSLKQASFLLKSATGISYIKVFDRNGFFLQDSNGSNHFVTLIFSQNREIKLQLQSSSTIDPYKVGFPNMISNLENISDSLWINSSPPDCHGAYLKKCAENEYDLYGWPRSADEKLNISTTQLQILSSVLIVSQQYVHVLPFLSSSGGPGGVLELVDPAKKSLTRINLRASFPVVERSRSVASNDRSILSDCVKKIIELTNGQFLILSHFGECLVFQSVQESIDSDLKMWRNLTGSLGQETLALIYEGGPEKFVSSLYSKGNSEIRGIEGTEVSNEEEKDGEGGIGKGIGGAGRGYSDEARKSGKIDDSFNLREIGEQSKISEAQKDLHHQKFKERLDHLGMTSKDYATFQRYRHNVQMEIRELRSILESVEAKNKERIWRKNQVAGDIDEEKLVASLTGERAIYKVRGENDDDFFQTLPKRMFFVFDLSASMMRFNGHDGRMDRSLECALMLMEAFKGFEYKFSYKFFGHSGDGPALDLIPNSIYPKNEKEIFDILNRMQTHASYTMSGDNTLDALSVAVKAVTVEDADDYFVILLSDANLNQYNISPISLVNALQADSRVNASLIFLGNISNQADRIANGLNIGQSFNCFDNKDLPKIIKSIFLKSMLK